MSRADFNFAKNFSGNQNFDNNFDGFDEVWQTIEDMSTISFELLIPKENLIKRDDEKSPLSENIFAIEELLMRQNLVDLAVKENATVKENKKNPYVDLLVKKDKDIYTTNFINYLPQITEDDIKFFELIASNKNIMINNNNTLLITDENGTTNRQSLNFSKSLMNLIEYSYTSNKPIRIDFGKDLAVILKIDKQGMISAEFISSDKAMEYLLKTNIPHLREKLDSSGIKYKKIYYRDEEESE
ncbi:MAG: hypothetical protein PHE78_03445 [Candidatus Gastranaerophilales bacterium]|nr:hypothetical protein [Candidatus Gastranaerophilales bacterium]